jgi:hypothetical protein
VMQSETWSYPLKQQLYASRRIETPILFLQCVGPAYDGFCYFPATGARGGIPLAWDSSKIRPVLFHWRIFVFFPDSINLFGVTVVYGPQKEHDKIRFLKEMRRTRANCPGAWAVGHLREILI